MPNAHAADKEVMGFYIPRTLAARVRKAAKARQITVTAFIEETLIQGTRHVELSPEDYEAIAEATRRALHAASRKRTGSKNQDGGKG